WTTWGPSPRRAAEPGPPGGPSHDDGAPGAHLLGARRGLLLPVRGAPGGGGSDGGAAAAAGGVRGRGAGRLLVLGPGTGEGLGLRGRHGVRLRAHPGALELAVLAAGAVQELVELLLGLEQLLAVLVGDLRHLPLVLRGLLRQLLALPGGGVLR